MNNLKRVLSLGLTGAMLSGMMLVGAGAVDIKDFTDSGEIQNQDAVTTMAALGVIAGKDTGAFDPAGSVTRAEMAKMITVMLNGGKDPVLGTKATPTYTDIDNHWAESYIEYCTTEGVISGQGDGTFNPDGSVTGSQAAKMALVALGYDSTAYNFTGVDWEINTNRFANSEADLYDGLETIDPTQPLNRDNAAQMLYNVLDAHTKKMIPTTSTNGTVEYTYQDGNSFMQEKFGAVKVEGVVVGNEVARLTSSSTGSSLDANRTYIEATNYKASNPGNGEQSYFDKFTIQATTGLNELGRGVNVYVKIGSSTSKAEIMGDVIVSEDNVVVTDYSGDSIATVADDNGLNLVSGTKTALNYASVANYTSSVAGNSTRGVEKILIDNDDNGDVDYVLLNTYAFGKVTSLVTTGDGSITVSLGSGATPLTADDKKDVVGFDDVAKNDYVLAASIGGNLYVEKAESVTGELVSYKTDSKTGNTTKLEVDGTNHNVSWVAGYTGGTDNILAASTYGASQLNNEATFYMGKGEYIAAVGEVVENAYKYALVLAGDTTGVSDQVRVALSDGTKGTYTLNTNGDAFKASTPSTGEFTIGDVCAYTLSSNGTIKLTKVSKNTNASAAVANFTKGKTTISGGTDNAYVNASTAFFYQDTTGYSAGDSISSKAVDIYTGYTSAPSIPNTGVSADVYKNGSRVVAVVFKGTTLTTADMDNLMYIYGNGNSNSDFTYVDTFLNDSADRQTGLKLDIGSSAVEGVFKYTTNSDGYYETETITPATYSTGWSGNLLESNYSSTNTSGKTYGVYSANSRTVVIGEWNPATEDFSAGTLVELKVTSNTLFIDDSSDLDDPVAELGAGPDEGDKIAYVVFSLDNGAADEAKVIVIKRNQAVAPKAAATAPTTAQLASSTATVTSSPVTLTANGTVGAAVTGYVDSSADTVKATFTAAASTTLGQITVSINGATAVDYNSGDNIDLDVTAGSTATLVFTVPVTGTGMAPATYTYTVNVTTTAP